MSAAVETAAVPRDRQFVQSLERGLDVIRALSVPGAGRTLSDVSHDAGLPRASARRFLLTLERIGYVRSEDRRFALTPRVLELGYAFLSSLSLPQIVQPHLRELVEQVHESSSVSVLDGTEIVYVAREPTQRIMTVTISVGTRFPAYATSMGRVLLSGLDGPDLDAFLRGLEPTSLARSTVTDKARLRREIDRVRRQGWALVDQELEDGLRSIAAPLHTPEGRVVAAINLSTHASRRTPTAIRRDLLPPLLRTAEAIEGDLAAGEGAVIDVDQLTAIDVHVHAERNEHQPQDPVTSELLEAAARYFGAAPIQPTAREVADYYRERNLLAVIFTVDDEAGIGRRRLGNEEVLAAARENPDVLIPFASVDPHKGKLAVREITQLIEAGARGFKFHPNTQAFWPNDRDHYRLYEPIAQAGLIALFHSGTTGIGAGMPGGGGVRLKYSNPMCVDDVAADFPELKIILAHPSFPWQDEALAIAVHKPNVYIDLSGWSPKYFPENLIRYTNTQLKHKTLFGSDYPLITPDRWLSDFERIAIKDEVRPLVLKENAAALLGLRG